jgi:[ribosomal protein S18]-alanine N-acetyltransferase
MIPRLFDPTSGDFAALASLHATSFPESWSANAIRELFAGAGVFAYYLPDGFILARAVGDEAEILTLAVTPRTRRQGRGRLLIRAAAHHAQKQGVHSLFLEVAANNIAAQALYQGQGFIAVGRRQAYYGLQDADVLKVMLPLSNSEDFA